MGRPKGSKNGVRLTLKCSYCSLVYQTDHASSKFCTHKCFTASRRKHGNCKHCNAVFRNGKGTECCSRSCAQRLRPRKSGYNLSEEHRKKIGDAQRGAKANNWQGGIYPEVDAIRRRAEYKAWRKAVYERDDYTCQMCGVHGNELNADHIKPFAKYPDLRTEITNGRTLCVPCHKKTPSYARNIQYQ